MTAKKVAVITPEESLARIATEVNAEFGKGIDAQFAIGHLLNEARVILPGDAEFGQWVKAQAFGFSQQTANRLQAAALREPEVRDFIAHSARSGRDLSPTSAIKELNAGPKAEPFDDGVEAEQPDPAFVALRTAWEYLTPPNDGFLGMHIDDMAASAGYIKDLVGAYQAAKKERGA